MQLCKTLYSLLQDAPEEQELLKAMGKVANSLLGTGEENVKAELSFTADAGTPATLRVGEPSEGISSLTETPPTPPQSESLGAGDSSSRTAHAVTEDSGEDSTSDDAGQSVPDTIHPPGTGAGSSVSPADSADSPTSAIEDSFEQAMANAAELEEKWILSFEQFVGALQREPFLCQFFAEQNSIDLSGTSVDPVLNPYTRTIMATSP